MIDLLTGLKMPYKYCSLLGKFDQIGAQMLTKYQKSTFEDIFAKKIRLEHLFERFINTESL